MLQTLGECSTFFGLQHTRVMRIDGLHEWDSGGTDVDPVAGVTTHPPHLGALDEKLTKESYKEPQPVIQDSCRAISKRLQQVVDAEGS